MGQGVKFYKNNNKEIVFYDQNYQNLKKKKKMITSFQEFSYRSFVISGKPLHERERHFFLFCSKDRLMSNLEICIIVSIYSLNEMFAS